MHIQKLSCICFKLLHLIFADILLALIQILMFPLLNSVQFAYHICILCILCPVTLYMSAFKNDKLLLFSLGFYVLDKRKVEHYCEEDAK